MPALPAASLLALVLLSLLACSGVGSSPPPEPPPEPPPGAALVEVVGAVPESRIAGLVWTPGGVVIAATSEDGRTTRLVRFDGAGQEMVLRTVDGEVGSLHAAGASLLWSTPSGAWRWVPGEGAPEALPVPAHAAPVVPAGDALLVGAGRTATLVDAAGQTEPLVPSDPMYPGDLAASDAVVAWVDQQAVWARVGDGAPALVRDKLRRPHGLSADGAALIWAESEADLLPGRASGSFYAAHDGAQWRVQELPFSLWSSGSVLRDGVIYGAASCAAVGAQGWTRFDLGSGGPPVAVGPARLHWIRWDHETAQTQILSAPRAACAPQR